MWRCAKSHTPSQVRSANSQTRHGIGKYPTLLAYAIEGTRQPGMPSDRRSKRQELLAYSDCLKGAGAGVGGGNRSVLGPGGRAAPRQPRHARTSSSSCPSASTGTSRIRPKLKSAGPEPAIAAMGCVSHLGALGTHPKPDSEQALARHASLSRRSFSDMYSITKVIRRASDPRQRCRPPSILFSGSTPLAEKVAAPFFGREGLLERVL